MFATISSMTSASSVAMRSAAAAFAAPLPFLPPPPLVADPTAAVKTIPVSEANHRYVRAAGRSRSIPRSLARSIARRLAFCTFSGVFRM